MQSPYVQTDFDLTSARSLAPLRASLVSHGLVEVNAFRRGRLWCAGFETTRNHRTAEQCVRALLKVVATLDPKSRALLRACATRDVDIAFDVGAGLDRFVEPLKATTIRALAAHDIGVRVTLYGKAS